MSSFEVRVSKDYTVFAAAHFVTYDGDKIEPLHGHNYRAAASVEGDLDANGYVFNFTLIKQALRSTCDRLDHRVLLPTGNPLLDIEREDDTFVVRSAAKRYQIPAEDVVQLPIRNTTSELLADWIAAQLEDRLRAAGVLRPGVRALIVELEESVGQKAICRRDLRWR
jgi:6-pyruvoyltetrahydropterin/6-carboxytetrahydropterin synthase